MIPPPLKRCNQNRLPLLAAHPRSIGAVYHSVEFLSTYRNGGGGTIAGGQGRPPLQRDIGNAVPLTHSRILSPRRLDRRREIAYNKEQPCRPRRSSLYTAAARETRHRLKARCGKEQAKTANERGWKHPRRAPRNRSIKGPQGRIWVAPRSV